MLDNPKNRLKNFIASLGNGGEAAFEAACGLGNGYVSNFSGNMTDRTKRKIKQAFPEIDLDYIATGIHSVKNTEYNQSDYLTTRRNLKNSATVATAETVFIGVPIFDVPIDASFLERFRDETIFEPIGFLNIPKLRNCNFAAVVSGSSMYPVMKSGTIAACRIINQLDYFDEGEMYFVSTVNGFETVKYVQSGENDDEIILIPHNEKIRRKPIKKASILQMCIVEAWLNFR